MTDPYGNENWARNRFGFGHGPNGTYFTHGLESAAKMFGVTRAGDPEFPTFAWYRAVRFHQGTLKPVPISYLASIPTPGDFTAEELRAKETALAAFAQGQGATFSVRLPAGQTPIVEREYLPILAAAREFGTNEVAVRVFYD
jgi:hypothetical protein